MTIRLIFAMHLGVLLALLLTPSLCLFAKADDGDATIYGKCGTRLDVKSTIIDIICREGKIVNALLEDKVCFDCMDS